MYTIQSRLLWAFLGVIVTLSLVSISFLALSVYLTSKYRYITNTMIAEYQLVDSMGILIDAFNKRAQSAGAQTTAQKEEQRITDTEANAKSLIAYIDGQSLDRQSESDYIGFKASLEKFTNHIDDSLARSKQNSIKDYFDDFNEANQEYGFVQENGTRLLFSELKYASSVRDEIEKIYSVSMLIGIVAFAVLVLGCVFFVLRFSSRFVAPLSLLTAFAEKIASGDMSARIGKLDAASMEVESLSHSLETMVHKLVENVEVTTKSAQALALRNQELDRLNKLMIDRELKMVELKREIAQLKSQIGLK